MLKFSAEDRRQFSLLVTPSWLSGLIAVVAGIVVSVGVIVVFQFHNSAVQQQLIAWEQTLPQQPLTTPDQTVTSSNHPTLSSSWPLLLLWSAAGLIVYFIAAAIVHSVSNAIELRKSLDYVNAQPRATVTSVVEHVLLRLVATIVLVVLLIIFIHEIIPYSITAAHASASDVFSVDGGLYALLSFGLIVVTLHVQTILLRLVVGRPRLLSGA